MARSAAGRAAPRNALGSAGEPGRLQHGPAAPAGRRPAPWSSRLAWRASGSAGRGHRVLPMRSGAGSGQSGSGRSSDRGRSRPRRAASRPPPGRRRPAASPGPARRCGSGAARSRSEGGSTQPGGRFAQVRRRAGDAVIRRRGPCSARERAEQPERVRVARGAEQRGAPRRCSTTRPAYITAMVSAISISSDRSWVMNRIGEAEPVTQRGQLLQDLPLGDHVQRGGRLVHDHDLRLQRQRHRDHDPLPHAARQLVRIAAQPVGADADQVQQLGRPAPAARASWCRAGARAARR